MGLNTPPQTVKSYFLAIKIIYYALIAGQLVFAFLTFYLIRSGLFDGEQTELINIFIYIVPIFVIGGLFISHLLFKSFLNTARGKKNLYEKLAFYRSALIIRYALLEGPSFFAIVVYLLTGDYLFLGMSGLVILVFFTLKPTVERAINDLELHSEESYAINNPNTMINEIMGLKRRAFNENESNRE
jgi:hypothetical protein